MAALIVLGSAFAPPDDPVTRVLVTRHWPRGLARGAVDQWEPQLGPAPDLADALARAAIDRAAFAEAYRAQLLGRPSLLDWVARMAAGTGVALLGEPYDDEACHRGVLAAVLRERIG